MINSNAEHQLLNAIIQRPQLVDHYPDLSASDFGNVHLGKIFDQVLKLRLKRKIIDFGALNLAMDQPWVDDCIDRIISHPCKSAAGNLVERVQHDAVRRGIDACASRIGQIAKEERNGTVALDRATAEMSRAAAKVERSALKNITESLPQTIQTLREPAKRPVILETGLNGLTLSAGLVTVLSGRPGMGKSALMLNIAANLAQTGKKVFFASLEDTTYYANLRMAARFANIDYLRLVHGRNLTEDDFQRLREFKERTKTWNLHIDEGSRQTIGSIHRTASMLQSRGLLDVVLVDHLAHMSDPKDIYASTTANMQGFCHIAKGLNVPVLLAHQLGRKCEERTTKTKDEGYQHVPELSDLRGSGEVEQLARGVWLLYRPAYYHSWAPENLLRIYIEKATHGICGKRDKHIDLSRMDIGEQRNEYEQAYHDLQDY